MKIQKITARQILDSRGNPTVEAEVFCEGGFMGRSAVPSGASTGDHEAYELRDNGSAFFGKGVLKAVKNIEDKIAPALIGLPADDQYRLDEIMIQLDGTENKSKLGANAILAVSLAAAHAAAKVRSLPLFKHINDVAHNPDMTMPMPMLNVLNGGKHAIKSADFQEYMLVPTSANTYSEAIQITAEIFANLKKLLQDKDFATTVGAEGGFSPSVKSNVEMLDLLTEACETTRYNPGKDVHFALDVAASEFFTVASYNLATEGRTLDDSEMIAYLHDITNRYPVVSVEDGLSEDGWSSWAELTETLSGVQIVGDDLLVTNQTRLEKAIDLCAGNAILIKPNQIGTLTETLRTIKMAHEAGWKTIVSHRSGETEDVTIAHLAIGAGAGQIKTGSVSRGERTAKHNELMRIEDNCEDLVLSNPFIV